VVLAFESLCSLCGGRGIGGGGAGGEGGGGYEVTGLGWDEEKREESVDGRRDSGGEGKVG